MNNQYRNPLTLAFPAAQPLSAERLPEFLEHAGALVADLNLLRDSSVALAD